MPETTNHEASDQSASELLARIHELEATVAALEDTALRYRRLIEATYEGVLLYHHGRIADANPALAAMLGYTLPELIGLPITVLLAPESLPTVMHHVQTGYELPYEVTGLRKDGSTFPAELRGRTLTIYAEEVRVTAVRDISERRAAEAERQRLQEEIIAAHAAALAELSTPLLLISEGVLLMPLVGSLDTARAQQVLETILEGVAAHRAEAVILDISGTPLVDTAVANALLRAAQAVSLLGARVMLTGIGPEVAQTIVNLGVTLAGIETYGSLQHGIAAALRRAARSRA